MRKPDSDTAIILGTALVLSGAYVGYVRWSMRETRRRNDALETTMALELRSHLTQLRALYGPSADIPEAEDGHG